MFNLTISSEEDLFALRRAIFVVLGALRSGLTDAQEAGEDTGPIVAQIKGLVNIQFSLGKM
jgi:hypothetical protein